jgi:hypothetical protein
MKFAADAVAVDGSSDLTFDYQFLQDYRFLSE